MSSIAPLAKPIRRTSCALSDGRPIVEMLHPAVPRPPSGALPRNEAARREGVQDARGLVFAEAAPEPDLRTGHQDAPAHLVHEPALIEDHPLRPRRLEAVPPNNAVSRFVGFGDKS